MSENKHWTLRVGNSENFVKSSHRGIWGVNSENNKTFIANVKPGDTLWFIGNKPPGHALDGRIIAVATFVSKIERDIGPIFSLTSSNEELGWTGEKGGQSNTEIHYANLYNLKAINLYTGLKRGNTICSYDTCLKFKEDMLLNLPEEYEKIVKYSQITNAM